MYASMNSNKKGPESAPTKVPAHALGPEAPPRPWRDPRCARAPAPALLTRRPRRTHRACDPRPPARPDLSRGARIACAQGTETAATNQNDMSTSIIYDIQQCLFDKHERTGVKISIITDYLLEKRGATPKRHLLTSAITKGKSDGLIKQMGTKKKYVLTVDNKKAITKAGSPSKKVKKAE